MPSSLSARRFLLMPLLALVVTVAALALGPAPQASAAVSSRVARATDIALHQVGDPYRYGAAGPSSFDCSGLVYYAFRRAGISVPRTAAAQASRAHRIPRSKLRRGDMMFFYGSGGVYHVGIFLRWINGRAQLLHSPRTGQRVSKTMVWTNSWFAGTLR